MPSSKDRAIELERANNLWSSFARKFEPHTRGTCLEPDAQFPIDRIGGLSGAKDEILTYAYAATSPTVYKNWGTHPPSGIMLIGRHSSGKTLLARALASLTETSFLRVDVPRLVLDVVHSSGKAGELIQGWSEVLEEMPQLTVFFDELEFSQAQEIGGLRADLPLGPIMDFLLELVDRTIAAKDHLVVGSTSHPDTLRPAFLAARRFERIVEVNPVFPDDVVETLQIHAGEAEKRAARVLFEGIDWRLVVGQTREAAPGDWVRILHAVLRRKARREAAHEDVTPVTTADLKEEVERFKHAEERLRVPEVGNYL
jgi:SpoVK/Ycf46/Vps4 family AAA+-type ATPase